MRLGTFFVLAVLLFSSFSYSCIAQSASSHDRLADFWNLNKEEKTEHHLAESSKWTFMVYLDADNNLETFGIEDFLEMAAVGSSGDVNIVVQMDRTPKYNSEYGNWTDCKRYFITQSMTPTSENAVEDLDEANMGNPEILTNFIVWTIQNYPADNYLAVLWNHGNGWRSTSMPEVKGVCFDDTDGDYLTTAELEQALASAESICGVKVDIVGFDACMMGMIEIAYQLKDYADLIVASEEVEPGYGWPYDHILLNLTNSPTMLSDDLATVIVKEYTASAMDEFVTLSASNLDLLTYDTIDDLATATSNFAHVLQDKLQLYRNEITQARQQTEEYFDETYVDLYHFAQLIYAFIPDLDVQAAANQVIQTLTGNIIEEGHRSEHPNSHGLSIYFPSSSLEYFLSYDNLAFAINNNWDEFLKEYLGLLFHNVAAVNITSSKSIIGQGYSAFINVTVENEGNYTENCNITVYAETIPVASQNITIPVESSSTLTFTWNTTGFSRDNYTISAYILPVPSETDTLDNRIVYGDVRVGVSCDVTGPIEGVPDDVCNMRDIGYFCEAFGGQEPNCDVTGPAFRIPDGIVNMRDIGEACNNFMKT